MAILRRVHRLFMSLTIPLFLTGCYQEFEPKVDTNPVLCVNSVILPGEPIEVKVTHSWLYSDSVREWWGNSGDMTDNTVDDANIYTYVNGELKSEEYIPKEGDSIHIVVESAKYGTAEASVVVPTAVPISLVKALPNVISVNKDSKYPMYATIHFSLKADLEIGRTSSDETYFELVCKGYTYDGEEGYQHVAGYGHAEKGDFNPGSVLDIEMLDSDMDPIFKEFFTAVEDTYESDTSSFLGFSNRQFRGKGYVFTAMFQDNYFSVFNDKYDPEIFDCEIEFTLMSVSRSFFNYALYEWEWLHGFIGQFEDTGLADPIWGYSNVSTGAGVVAAYSISTCTISLRDFLEAAFKDAQTE